MNRDDGTIMSDLISAHEAPASDNAIEGTDMVGQVREPGFEQSFFFALFQASGFALFLTWLFASFLGFDVFSETIAPLEGVEHIAQMSNIVAFVVGLCASGVLANQFVLFPNNKILWVTLMLTAVVIIMAGLRIMPLQIVAITLGVIVNAAGGYQLLCWVAALSRFSTTMTPFFLALSTMFAALLSYVLFSFPQPLSSIFILCVLAGSIAMMLLLIKRHPPLEGGVSKDDSKARRPLFWKTRIAFALFGFIFGGAFYGSVVYGSWAAFSLSLAVGAVAASIDIWQAGGVMIERMRRIITVGTIVSMLGIVLFSDEQELVCWCAIMALFAYAFVMQANWTILSARVFSINAVYMYVRSQRLFWVFLVFGWIISWAITGAVNASLVVVSTSIALLVIMSLFFVHGDLEDLKLLAIKTDDSDRFDVKRVSHFKQKCNAVAQQFELTPRETEVFVLMAKGRNAESIGEELTISHYTAKTHIYHVYQKTGVNSRQAIIDMVENYPTSKLV